MSAPSASTDTLQIQQECASPSASFLASLARITSPHTASLARVDQPSQEEFVLWTSPAMLTPAVPTAGRASTTS